MEVVRGLNLERYMGVWYEIASIPSWLQPKDGVDTRATYTLNPDGASFRILNETWSRGKRNAVEGTAYWADPKSDEAKLKFKFYVPPVLPVVPIVGDYWVLYVDDEYGYTLVGEPPRRYLWILCRTNHMDDDVYNMLLQKAKDAGYDVNKLRKTPHSDHPPESEQGPRGFWWLRSFFAK